MALDLPPETAPASDSINADPVARTVKSVAVPRKLLPAPSYEANTSIFNQLTEEEPAPASPLALPATVADKVFTDPSAEASMVTDSSAIKLLRVTVAVRCDSMVLNPNAKAAAKPLDAAKPPAKDWMLEDTPLADSPALT